MKHFILLFTLLLAIPLSAAANDLMVRVLPDCSELFAGDSMLVSVVLYADHPIAQAECTTNFEVKGKCRVRRLNIQREATAGRVREGQHIYYTLVWAQYVVAPDKAGSYTIPAQKFEAVLHEVVSMPDFFDQMMGARPEYREHKTSAKSRPFKFEVKPKPLRSTLEMMQHGQVL